MDVTDEGLEELADYSGATTLSPGAVRAAAKECIEARRLAPLHKAAVEVADKVREWDACEHEGCHHMNAILDSAEYYEAARASASPTAQKIRDVVEEWGSRARGEENWNNPSLARAEKEELIRCLVRALQA